MIKIPSYVSKQNPITVRKYVAVRGLAGGGDVGKLVADKWLKTQYDKASSNPRKVTSMKFDLVDDGMKLVKKTSSGEDYVDFVMADNLQDSSGQTIKTSVLEQWAKDINDGSGLIGDIDHEEYDYVSSNVADPEEAAGIISKMKKGIAKTIKAFVKKGKLFVRAIIDKRYRKHIEKAKGVSLEAFLDTINTPEGELVTGGKLLGFTFAIKDNPVNSRAVII